MYWKTLLSGAAGTLLLLSGCSSTGTSASFSPNEIHIDRAELAVEGVSHDAIQPLSGEWQVKSRWWPVAISKSPRTSDGSANFQWSDDGTQMVGAMDVGVGTARMRSSLVVGVDASTDGFVMGWNAADGSSHLPLCLAIEGTPVERMVIERSAGKTGMVREVLSEVTDSTFRYERYRSTDEGIVYKDLEITGTR